MTEQLRAWWSHRQGLDGALAGASAAEVLARTGWARAVGGSGSYLTLFARSGLSREAADAAAAAGEIRELPSARGCTYVLPQVRLAQRHGRDGVEHHQSQPRSGKPHSWPHSSGMWLS